jgi:6,7-dimethyl-8-ribityllumazine synthase
MRKFYLSTALSGMSEQVTLGMMRVQMQDKKPVENGVMLMPNNAIKVL